MSEDVKDKLARLDRKLQFAMSALYSIEHRTLDEKTRSEAHDAIEIMLERQGESFGEKVPT